MNHTKTFLDLLDPNASKFLFAGYDYRKELKGRQIYGELDRLNKKLETWNKEVFCIYVTINETFGKERKKSSAKRARAIWVEDDTERNEPRDDWPLQPSMIVQSSEKKYHYYWLTSTEKLDEWEKVMTTMVKIHGCDKNARDVVRVMRLPGYLHRKDLKNPFMCKIHSQSGARYKWFQIKKAFPPYQPDVKDKKVKESEEYDESNAINDLMTSKNYHGSLVSISMSLTNRGISRELQYMTLFGLMHKIPERIRREEWEARVSDGHLYECIDTAIKKKEEEDKQDQQIILDEIDEKKIKNKNVEFPPGKIGELCEEILEMAPYPNKEIAVSAAIGLVAGITGRSYNVLGMGLNIYIAILADSGIGKANLKDSINMALRAGGGKFNVGASFVGKSRFTGPKAIFNMLSEGLSRICVIEEAGLISESMAGDVAGVTRVLLDLYTSCGYGKWAGDEGYSQQKESIPTLHSPALSVINVSTPKSFINALHSKSADLSGEIARLWIMRSIGEKPYLNLNRRLDFSEGQIKTLGLLVTTCKSNQDPKGDLKITQIQVPEKILGDSNKWVDRENEYLREGDTLKRTLCSRAFAKIIKLASICSVYNGKVEVGVEEYEWASKQVNNEIENISTSFTHEISTDLSIVCKETIFPSIAKILTSRYRLKNPKAVELAKHGVFTFKDIQYVLKNNSVLRDMDDDTTRNNPKTGLEKCIGHMLRTGFIHELSNDDRIKIGTKSKRVYKITEDFKSIYANEDK